MAQERLNNRMGYAIPAVLFALIGILLIFILPNMTNLRVPAGYAGYIYSRPIFGKSQFQGVLIGPASTGWKWRLAINLLSVTPYTYAEEFNAKEAALAKDKLPLDARCHIVWRLKKDEKSVKSFLEEFGGMEDGRDPDKIAAEAYKQFIREPFRTEARAALAEYNGLDINAELVNISKSIRSKIVERLNSSPFEVMDIVMGNANPPQVVIDAISEKVASEQKLQQRSIQLSIAEKNVLIETTEGRAVGARAAAQAEEEAKAIAAIKAVISPEYISYLGVQNIKGAQRVYVPASSNILIGTQDLPHTPQR